MTYLLPEEMRRYSSIIYLFAQISSGSNVSGFMFVKGVPTLYPELVVVGMCPPGLFTEPPPVPLPRAMSLHCLPLIAEDSREISAMLGHCIGQVAFKIQLCFVLFGVAA